MLEGPRKTGQEAKKSEERRRNAVSFRDLERKTVRIDRVFRALDSYAFFLYHVGRNRDTGFGRVSCPS
jgi:hypothetical protein